MAERDGGTGTGRDGEHNGDEQEDGGLCEADREWVRRTVAELGPLTDVERVYLAFLFNRRV